MATRELKRLRQRVWEGEQSWHYEALWQLTNGDRVLVNIKRNAYDSQSHAHAQLFSPTARRWNTVVSLPITLLHCRELNYVTKNVRPSVFERDEKTLLDEVMVVLDLPESQ